MNKKLVLTIAGAALVGTALVTGAGMADYQGPASVQPQDTSFAWGSRYDIGTDDCSPGKPRVVILGNTFCHKIVFTR